MTSPSATPRTPLERIEWQCSHLDEGKRYCDFCGEVIFPPDESHPHKDDCEVAQIKRELSALQRQPETATQQDAERYRFVRAQSTKPKWTGAYSGTALDEAIDLARREQK